MKDETTDRDPRLKQTILTWDFPTRVTVATNDSTYIEKEEDFISQYCLTGYKSIKYFIPQTKLSKQTIILMTALPIAMQKPC